MRHRKRKVLAVLAMSAAAMGAGVGVGLSSAGAATAAVHHTATVSRAAATSYTTVRPTDRAQVRLTSSSSSSATKVAGYDEQVILEDDRALHPHGLEPTQQQLHRELSTAR